MAFHRLLLSISMLLLSLVVVVLADGYKYAPTSEVEKVPKTNLEKPKIVGFDPKPKIEKPKKENEYTPKSKENGYGNSPKPKLEKSRKQGKLLPSITGIQGLICCKFGSKLIPLEGALARITCLAIDKNGYESVPFSILSRPTNAKGYFFAAMSRYELEDEWKLTGCKAFLEKSPSEICKVPTDVNNGISGAALTSYQLLKDKNLTLYSVGPFFYTPEPKQGYWGY